ncbi:hypothetical protein K1T71_009804 [Dendrolimus kikuchii]|uniref:Uncharacterized protein n=1 Tax=Dendrolimus kikuchii TaxID=765133 RepID=A0ACC1CT22_9NEOP|nr:hypothetical protein K1T71_009804 [Dendrolimus kikuchii]
MIVENIPISNDKLSIVKKETKCDPQFNILIDYLNKGWPHHKCQLPNEIKSYWSVKNDLFVVDGVLFKDNLVLIPKKMRNEMLKLIHEGHLGIDRCKRRARQVIFWPGMTRDIEMYVKRCVTCKEHSNSPSKEPLMPIHIPELPWHKVGSDIFEFKNKHFLLLVDYYSNFVEVCKLNDLTSNTVIQRMKEIFSRYGIPSELMTDNGTQFSSREFKNFTKIWGFNHITSSPNYAQSNGKSERAVQTVKKLLKKSILSNSDFNLALLNYRNTPRDGLSSPAQLLMGRTLRCQLPINYDKHCKSLPILKKGDNVITINGKNRNKGIVVGHAIAPRSYIVQSKLGRQYRRNRRHLIKCENDVKSPYDGNIYEDADCNRMNFETPTQEMLTENEKCLKSASPLPQVRQAKKIAKRRIEYN